ncbi:hypothetical protein Bca4012_077352 [Brassica carinata]|uniref:Uncharacterized protein n=3 Tax=Brassica TaxID=3705 RepID=A0A0D3D7M1_BRAOL|nr:unnamed protein product [Brassica napus]VDD37167.1 unnamed protein product [Brassica oleracea]
MTCHEWPKIKLTRGNHILHLCIWKKSSNPNIYGWWYLEMGITVFLLLILNI